MFSAVVLICVVAMAASAPTYPMPVYVINVDAPEGRHVQMGEPGKAVSGYYTSRSLDGQMEYKTMYEADDKGFRVRGDHLPSSSLPDPEGRSPSGAAPTYIFKYDNTVSGSHYQMGEPGKSVQGSYMYYDTQGRAQRVDYEADENGYRVKPAEPAPEISSGTGEVKVAEPVVAEVAPVAVAEPIPVAEIVPVVEVAAEPVPVVEVAAEPVPVVEAVAEPAPAAAEPVEAARGRPSEVYFNMNQIERAQDESAPTIVVEEPIPEPAVVAAEPEVAVVAEADPAPAVVADVKVEAAAETEVKVDQPKLVALPVHHPVITYFRSLPYVQQPAAFHYPSYGYGIGYPYFGGNYFYTV